MGGFGSGRHGGRPIADSSLQIDLAWMLRQGFAREGARSTGTLSWQRGGQPSGSVSFVAGMEEAGRERLQLAYSYTRRDERVEQRQSIDLTYTLPNFGGKRWWMLCPINGERVRKLYLPLGGDLFASRRAWRLGYQCQRDAARDRPFERLFRLQDKLGCERGWGNYPNRPKGMWMRTYVQLIEHFDEIDAECGCEMAKVMAAMARRQ